MRICSENWLRNSAILLLTCLISSCGMLTGSYNNFATLNGSGDDYEALTSDQSSLYSDGPVDLPITIAKLDSPDTSLINVELESISGSFLVSPSESTTSYLMTVSGSATATSSQYIIAYKLEAGVVNTESEEIVTTNQDGSFEFDIDISESDQVIFAALGDDLSTTSPFITIIPDIEIFLEGRSGAFIFVTTNTTNLRTNVPLSYDQDGNYFMSIGDESGDYTLMRRATTGAPAETLLEDQAESIDHVAAISDSMVATISGDGSLRLLYPSTTTNVSLAVTSLTQTLDVLENYDADSTRLFVTPNETALIVLQNGDNPAVHYYRTTTDLHTEIVPSGLFDDIMVLVSIDQNSMYVFGKRDGTYSLHSLDFDEVPGSAWENRTTLFNDFEIDTLHGADISNDQLVVMDVTRLGTRRMLYWSPEDGKINVSNGDRTLVNPKISPDGTMAVACLLDAERGNHLYYHVSALSNPSAVITSQTEYDECNPTPTSYDIDENNQLHFYRVPLGEGEAQHGIVLLNTLLE